LDMSAVNTEYIASAICPERFAFRAPVTFPLKTGLVKGATQFNLTTDANGNTASVINPWNVAYTGAPNAADFFALTNPTLFDPDTGSFGVAPAITPPLAGSIGNIEQIKIIGFSVKVTPIGSLTTAAGFYQIAYFPLANTLSQFGPFFLFSQVATRTNPYYQSGNTLTTYRSTFIPDQTDTYIQAGPASPEFEFFYILITGAAPNTNVATIEVNYLVEVIPTPDQVQITVMDYALPGVRTSDFLYAIHYMHPGLQMLTLDDAYEIADKIANSDSDYRRALFCFLKHISKFSTDKRLVGNSSFKLVGSNTKALSAIPYEDDTSFIYE
jgi:hypothetical protein